MRGDLLEYMPWMQIYLCTVRVKTLQLDHNCSIGLPTDDMQMTNFLQRLKILKHNLSIFLSIFTYTSLSFSATPVVSLSPASTLSCLKRKYDHLTHAEAIAAEKLILIMLMEACHVWDAMKWMAKRASIYYQAERYCHI